jgi:hypothetical protein
VQYAIELRDCKHDPREKQIRARQTRERQTRERQTRERQTRERQTRERQTSETKTTLHIERSGRNRGGRAGRARAATPRSRGWRCCWAPEGDEDLGFSAVRPKPYRAGRITPTVANALGSAASDSRGAILHPIPYTFGRAVRRSSTAATLQNRFRLDRFSEDRLPEHGLGSLCLIAG